MSYNLPIPPDKPNISDQQIDDSFCTFTLQMMIMKRIVLLLLSFIALNPIYSQESSVPFRVGNKFGVSDLKGKMLIPAEYDIVEPEKYGDYRYLTAYTLNGGKVLSTLIYKNKIILKNQAYASYYFSNGLIKASEYTVLRRSEYHSDKNFRETVHLYDLKGNRVLPLDYKSIAIIDEMQEDKKLDVVLLYTMDVDANNSIYLYDKKLKKITKTFIDHARSLEMNFNWDDNYTDRSITTIYLDKNGAGKKMTLGLKDKSIAILSEESINYRAVKQQQQDRYGFGDVNAIPEGPGLPPAPAINSSEEEIITTARKIAQKRGFYYLPKQIEELKISQEKLNKNEQYIISKQGKQGLFIVYNKALIVPVAYDEIIFADFEGRNGGYILRNGDRYGAFLYDHPKHKIVAPVFEQMPLLVDYNYFGEKAPLFKLYDKEGKLFCYANEHGKLFYKP